MYRSLILALLLVPALVVGQTVEEKNEEWNQSPFGERGVYQLESQFSYISVWGPTDLHDRISTSNGGTVSLVDGFLEVQSSATANATADLETVDRIIYRSGRQIEAAIKVGVKDAPTNGATAEWGIGTDTNGAFFRLDDGTLSVVYEHDGTEDETTRANMRGDAADCSNFDAVDDPAVYIIRFNWYGAGGASFFAYYPSDSETDTLRECHLHWEAPNSDSETWTNPNLPLFARVDAGANADNVNLTVGGRRAGTQGQDFNDPRSVGDFRATQTVGSADGLVPLICLKRESSFPTATDLNAVPVEVKSFGIATDQDLVARFVVDPDLTGASFGTPTDNVDGETAVVSDTSATALSSAKHVTAPFLVQGGSGNKQGPARSPEATNVPFIAEEPTCLAVDILGGTDGTVTSTLQAIARW